MISLASADDAARASVLLNASVDDQLSTVSGIRYRLESARPEDRRQCWRAESDGELVGWAYGGLDAFAPGRTAAFSGIVVHPAHRRKGTGAALWGAVSMHLEAIGARRIVAYGRADDDSVAFAHRCGFTCEATETSSRIDPRRLGKPPAAPAGIELRPMSAFDNNAEAIFAADLESSADEPGPSDFSGMTYETWQRHTWDHPDCNHELSAVALAEGIVVGTTFLYTDLETGRAMNGGTGVMRDFRGRGLGLLMKQHSLSWAAAAGIITVITQNDDSNAPMLAINARLGYEPFSTGHAWVLER